jgi:hypothetical protein
MRVIPQRHMPCWRALLVLDEVGDPERPTCNNHCSGRLRDLVDGDGVLDFADPASAAADPDLRPLVVDLACRKAAATMFPSRPQYLPDFLDAAGLREGCAAV